MGDSLGERKVYRLDDNEVILSPEVQELAKALSGHDHNLLKRLFVDGPALIFKASGDGAIVTQGTGDQIDIGVLKLINPASGELLETAGTISISVPANTSGSVRVDLLEAKFKIIQTDPLSRKIYDPNTNTVSTTPNIDTRFTMAVDFQVRTGGASAPAVTDTTWAKVSEIEVPDGWPTGSLTIHEPDQFFRKDNSNWTTEPQATQLIKPYFEQVVEIYKQNIRHRHYSGNVDIDNSVNGVTEAEIPFYIEDDDHKPTKILLALKGIAFPKVYYTQLGSHLHTLSGSATVSGATAGTNDTLFHTHSLLVNNNENDYVDTSNVLGTGGGFNFNLDVNANNSDVVPGLTVPGPYRLFGQIADSGLANLEHTHNISASLGGVVDNNGNPTVFATTANHTFLNNLRVDINGVDKSVFIQDNSAIGNGNPIGDGTGADTFHTNGTGIVDITSEVSGLGGGFPQLHKIKLSVVTGDTGGKVFYDIITE